MCPLYQVSHTLVWASRPATKTTMSLIAQATLIAQHYLYFRTSSVTNEVHWCDNLSVVWALGVSRILYTPLFRKVTKYGSLIMTHNPLGRLKLTLAWVRSLRGETRTLLCQFHPNIGSPFFPGFFWNNSNLCQVTWGGFKAVLKLSRTWFAL